MPLTPAPTPPTGDGDRYYGLPADRTDSAKETYVQIEEEDVLDAASRASLFEACSLFSLADAMAEQVAIDGFVVTGSAGQPAARPLLGEIRLCLVQAMAARKPSALHRISPPRPRLAPPLP